MGLDISKFTAAETIDVEILDPGTGEPLIGDDSKPCTVTVFSPGSKPFAAAKSAAGNKALKRLRRRGGADTTAEEDIASTASFLTAITKSFNNFAYKPDQFAEGGAEMFRACYLDLGMGWLTGQVNSGAGDWGNATKSSTPS